MHQARSRVSMYHPTYSLPTLNHHPLHPLPNTPQSSQIYNMSYFSNILTATKTRYAFLRQGDEADGDTEDDSHISRVLRNYCQEQQRAYPDWLGPPPNQRSQSPVTSLRNTYGRRPAQNAAPQHPAGTSLSDIFDAPVEQRPQIGRNVSSGSSRVQPQMFPDEQHHPQQGGAPQSGNLTAQQRIKERLWGSRGTASPSPPPIQQHQPPPRQGGRVEMPMPSGGQPYMAAGMPWDDGHGGGFDAPASHGHYGGGSASGGNIRRGASAGRPGLPNGARDGGQPYR